jgi:hypothetical protein
MVDNRPSTDTAAGNPGHLKTSLLLRGFLHVIASSYLLKPPRQQALEGHDYHRDPACTKQHSTRQGPLPCCPIPQRESHNAPRHETADCLANPHQPSKDLATPTHPNT